MTSYSLLPILMLLVPAGASGQQDQHKTAEAQIEEALSALPASMREAATVKGYDPSGEGVVLREGEGEIVCLADDPTVRAWDVVCYPSSLEDFVARSRQLTKEGADTPARVETLAGEITSGAITMPALGVLYLRTGNSADTAVGAMIFHVPHATGAESGLPTIPTRGAAWLAESGTVMAHIRVPMP